MFTVSLVTNYPYLLKLLIVCVCSLAEIFFASTAIPVSSIVPPFNLHYIIKVLYTYKIVGMVFELTLNDVSFALQMIRIRERVYNRENYISRKAPAIRIDNSIKCLILLTVIITCLIFIHYSIQ